MNQWFQNKKKILTNKQTKHFLASFLSRDQAFDQMVDIWKSSRASSTIEVHHNKLKDDASSYSGNESDTSSSSGYSYSDDDEEDEEDDTVNPTSVSTNQIQGIFYKSSKRNINLDTHPTCDG